MLHEQPGHLKALEARTECLPRLGRHADAVADLTALLKFFPEDAALFQQRARSYDALNDRSHADADRIKAAELVETPRSSSMAGPGDSSPAPRTSTTRLARWS